MKKLKVSEIFYSLQGEGRYVGVPSVFLRSFGCNLKCEGFGMPAGEKSNARNIVISDSTAFKTLHDLPLVSTGCDSYGSWDPRFKHLSPTQTVLEVADRLLEAQGTTEWHENVHLVITGGEPLLGWQPALTALLSTPQLSGLKHVTFETNGTKDLHESMFELFFNKPEITFSVSPKLSASGESWEDAIKPAVVANYTALSDNVYLKFVCDTENHILEALNAVSAYKRAGWNGEVYIMPTGGMVAGYITNNTKIAELCLKNKLNYTPRLHVDLWGNAWAT